MAFFFYSTHLDIMDQCSLALANLLMHNIIHMALSTLVQALHL